MVSTVYVGNTAALSFLGFLRIALRQHLGPSNFTDTEDREMLEVVVPEAQGTEFDDTLTDAEKGELVQCFLEAVSTRCIDRTCADANPCLVKWATGPIHRG